MKILGILILLTAPVGVAAQRPVPAAPSPVATAPWKVVGVGLGMTPAEVAAAMKAAGYSTRGRTTGGSWQTHVALEARLRRGVNVPDGPVALRWEAFAKGQEQVTVEYEPTAGGLLVKEVSYKIGRGNIEEGPFRSAVLARYGAPTRAWEKELHYCAVGEPNCDTAFFYFPKLPSLIVWLDDGANRSLKLVQGRAAEDAFERAVGAEVDRLYPKKDRPSF